MFVTLKKTNFIEYICSKNHFSGGGRIGEEPKGKTQLWEISPKGRVEGGKAKGGLVVRKGLVGLEGKKGPGLDLLDWIIRDFHNN